MNKERETLKNIFNRLQNMLKSRVVVKPQEFTAKQWADYKATTEIITSTLEMMNEDAKNY